MEVVLVTDPARLLTIAPRIADQYTVSLGLTFLVGSVLAVYSTKVPFDHRLGILSGLVFLFSLRYGGFATYGTVAAVYFIIYLAAALPRQVQWIGKKNDYSYGVYIYGFLVQQITAHLGWYKLGYFPYVGIALALTFGCAWISWHLVEKRAMSLKNWGPGRGIAHWRAWLAARVPSKTIKE
jgi:peptidoglycan/LPS O-acetylase OafA/YrhL